MTCDRIRGLLDLYLDGEADALSTRTVEEHVMDCPACKRQLAGRQALQQAIREKLPYHRAPAVLRRPVSLRPAWRQAFYPVAAGLLVAAGVLAGYSLRPPTSLPDPMLAMIRDAETDHLRSLQENHLIDVASSDQHTVKPWFAGKLPFAPAVPSPAGFPLRGGRLDWIEGQQAAALVYARDKHLINLFIWPAASGRELPAAPIARGTLAGHHLVYWSSAGLNYCAVSDVEAGQLQAFADAYRAGATP